MQITVLGSGGFEPTPKPLCGCPVCHEARINPTCIRKGPSFYLHGLDLMIDLPLECRSNIEILQRFPKRVTFSHWHPDHTEGWRVLEMFNEPPEVLIPAGSCILTRVPALEYLHSVGKVQLVEWEERDAFRVADITCRLFKICDEIPMFAFLAEDNNGRALICNDHSMFLTPRSEFNNLDLLIMNMGTGKQSESVTSLRDNLNIIEALRPRKTILTHVEESFGLTSMAIREFEKCYAKYNVSVATDGQSIEV